LIRDSYDSLVKDFRIAVLHRQAMAGHIQVGPRRLRRVRCQRLLHRASHDYGRTWSAPVRTNSDHRYWFAEGGAVAPGGAVYFAESAEHQSAKGNVELAVISSANGGRRWRTSIIAISQQQPRCRNHQREDNAPRPA
jgi:hypothetical protein